jgi:enamine deaminase RidA (YjgF/YER057c/UK114 family)
MRDEPFNRAGLQVAKNLSASEKTYAHPMGEKQKHQGDRTMSGDVEARLAKLGLSLPPAPSAVANYVPALMAGDLLFISGQIAKAADGSIMTGRVGTDITVEQGQLAARLCALNILAQAKAALGSLDRIVQVMRLTGFVNAAELFTDHPKVINGASDLMVDALGDAGRHTRAAVGSSSLPVNTAVEVDAIIRFR